MSAGSGRSFLLVPRLTSKITLDNRSRIVYSIHSELPLSNFELYLMACQRYRLEGTQANVLGKNPNGKNETEPPEFEFIHPYSL
jgi:hypothetical protein